MIVWIVFQDYFKSTLPKYAYDYFLEDFELRKPNVEVIKQFTTITTIQDLRLLQVATTITPITTITTITTITKSHKPINI